MQQESINLQNFVTFLCGLSFSKDLNQGNIGIQYCQFFLGFITGLNFNQKQKNNSIEKAKYFLKQLSFDMKDNQTKIQDLQIILEKFINGQKNIDQEISDDLMKFNSDFRVIGDLGLNHTLDVNRRENIQGNLDNNNKNYYLQNEKQHEQSPEKQRLNHPLQNTPLRRQKVDYFQLEKQDQRSKSYQEKQIQLTPQSVTKNLAKGNKIKIFEVLDGQFNQNQTFDQYQEQDQNQTLDQAIEQNKSQNKNQTPTEQKFDKTQTSPFKQDRQQNQYFQQFKDYQNNLFRQLYGKFQNDQKNKSNTIQKQIEKKQIQECKICLDTMNIDEQFILNCQHVFHKNCLQDYVVNQNQLPINCPSCPSEILNQDLRQFCNQQLFDKLEEATFKIFIQQNTQMFQCPTRDCFGIYEIEGTDQFCKFCQKTYCTKCKRLQHEGICGEVSFIKLAKKEKYCQCKKCLSWVEKISGCEHIKCKCGYEFCYQCSEQWKHSHICKNQNNNQRQYQQQGQQNRNQNNRIQQRFINDGIIQNLPNLF